MHRRAVIGLVLAARGPFAAGAQAADSSALAFAALWRSVCGSKPVRGAQGNPGPNARFAVTGLADAVSGADGRFVIAHVPPGTREIAVHAIGAEPFVRSVDVEPGDTAQITIEMDRVVRLAPIVVT